MGKGFEHRPTHGRTNIQYVQPMDDKMHTDLKLVKHTRPDHGRGNEEYITKTIQHMDEAKVIKNYKFKDVMKNHYSIMFFRRRIKTGVLIKITPMDEHELIF